MMWVDLGLIASINDKGEFSAYVFSDVGQGLGECDENNVVF